MCSVYSSHTLKMSNPEESLYLQVLGPCRCLAMTEIKYLVRGVIASLLWLKSSKRRRRNQKKKIVVKTSISFFRFKWKAVLFMYLGSRGIWKNSHSTLNQRGYRYGRSAVTTQTSIFQRYKISFYNCSLAFHP